MRLHARPASDAILIRRWEFVQLVRHRRCRPARHETVGRLVYSGFSVVGSEIGVSLVRLSPSISSPPAGADPPGMKPTVRRRFGGLFLSSEALLESFIQYARKIKFLLAETFGLRSKTDSEEDFYFGGSYFAAQIIPPPRLIESLFRGKRE